MLRTALAVSLLVVGAACRGPQPGVGRVAVSGMQMYYEVSGQGDPLIVLHGAYMNIPAMGAIIPRLAETHRVYALELQGHGRTTDIDRPITYPNLADDVAAFMDAVGLEQADVFGYSMGAAAGLQLVIRHPQRVTRLVTASVSYDAAGWQPEFKAFIPQPEVDREFYAEVPINIELVGGYHELATFFDELSRLDRIVNISNFGISNVLVKDERVKLAIGGVATTFRFISPEEQAAKAAAKAAAAGQAAPGAK